MATQRTSEPVGNELADLVGPFWTEPKACEALAVDLDELGARRAEGTVLAVTSTDGDRFYPVDQFIRREGAVEVRSGLLPLLRTLRGFDQWTVAVLLHTPAPELDGQTPLDWVREGGGSAALKTLASVVAREWQAGTSPS